MTTPLVVEQPLEFSATYTTLPVDPTMTVKIPALGNGWNFFWRVNSQGSLETGVTGGIVQAHWKTIKFNVARANSGHMSFSQTVDVAALAGKQWSGQVSNIQSYRNAGQATTSRLEIAINPILGVVEKPAIIPRIGTGYTDIHRAQFLNDVKFTFSPSDLVLWGNVDALSKASPYFRTLLASGFAESSPSKNKDKATKSKKERNRDFDDSDDESDDQVISRNANHPVADSPSEFDVPFRLVEIVAAAHTTYHAVLCWMHTGHIVFAPLRSSFRLQPDSVNLRNAALAKLHVDPSYPLPASPKSVYRLAHFLELDELAKLALANLESQLTKETLAFESFGDVAAAYDEVGEMEIELTVKEWAFVKGSAAMTEVQQMADSGGLPSAGAMSLVLCRKL